MAKTRRGGTSFPFAPDTRTKTARPESVGPHHAMRDQEDPANPGIDPQAGYANEIAELNRARRRVPAKGPVTPVPKRRAP